MSQENGRTPKRVTDSKSSHPHKQFIRDQNSSNSPPHENGSFLKYLRQEKGLSQRALAQKLGLPRIHIQRLEERSWEKYSARDLKLIGDFFGHKMDEIVQFSNGSVNQVIWRSFLKKPFFELTIDGAKFASFLPNPVACFIGTVSLMPQKTLSREFTPRGELVFYHVFEGELLITASKPSFLRVGEQLALGGSLPHELYNPHQFHTLVAWFISLPSFIRKDPQENSHI